MLIIVNELLTHEGLFYAFWLGNRLQRAFIRIFIALTEYETFLNKCGSLAWWLECSPMAQETRVKSQVASYQRL